MSERERQTDLPAVVEVQVRVARLHPAVRRHRIRDFHEEPLVNAIARVKIAADLAAKVGPAEPATGRHDGQAVVGRIHRGCEAVQRVQQSNVEQR